MTRKVGRFAVDMGVEQYAQSDCQGCGFRESVGPASPGQIGALKSRARAHCSQTGHLVAVEGSVTTVYLSLAAERLPKRQSQMQSDAIRNANAPAGAEAKPVKASN